jgi:hypothetical protein
VGKDIAEAAKKAGVTSVVFDRGGYLYHGRVKALADGARVRDGVRLGLERAAGRRRRIGRWICIRSPAISSVSGYGSPPPP